MDKIYIKPDEENIYFLDCTRVDGRGVILSRKGEPLEKQMQVIASSLRNKEIILADDVVFSGSVLKSIIKRFAILGVKVVGVISSICTMDAYEYFNQTLKFGIKSNYLLGTKVIDQICERDFYFGIAGSGIMIKTANELCKAPYFKPYGNPCERASIPTAYEKDFSRSCLDRSIFLWEEIEKIKKEAIFISELPEKIINTKENEEVVKILKRERKRL